MTTSTEQKLAELVLPDTSRPEGNGRFQYVHPDDIPHSLPSIGAVVIVSGQQVGQIGHYAYYSPRQLQLTAQFPVTVLDGNSLLTTMAFREDLIVDPQVVMDRLTADEALLDAAWRRWAPTKPKAETRVLPRQRKREVAPNGKDERGRYTSQARVVVVKL